MAPDVVPIKIDPDPLAPYAIAPGWRVGNLIFLSGQAALSPDGEIVGEGDFDAQVVQVMTNIRTVLQAAGSDLDRIVKVTIYLTDMSNFPKIVEARKAWLRRPIRRTPSWTCARSPCRNCWSKSMSPLLLADASIHYQTERAP